MTYLKFLPLVQLSLESTQIAMNFHRYFSHSYMYNISFFFIRVNMSLNSHKIQNFAFFLQFTVQFNFCPLSKFDGSDKQIARGFKAGPIGCVCCVNRFFC